MLRDIARLYRAGYLSRDDPAPEAPARPVFEGKRPVLPIPEAAAYVKSRELLNAVECSRRSGKTYAAVDRHIDLHAELEPGSWTHFGSLIKRNAYKHFWLPILERFEKLGWRVRKMGQHMIIRTERDTFIQAFGCDDVRDIKVVQGDKSALFTLDECHLPYDDILRALYHVAAPMTADCGGMLDMLGLPPDVPGGFFDEILTGGQWARFHWTMFDHDFPRAREEKLAHVMSVCRKSGLPIEVTETVGADGRPRYKPVVGKDSKGKWKTHPTVLQQYFGMRSVDPSKLAYEYEKGRNDYDPTGRVFDPLETASSAGLDLGWGDNDAIVVHSWDRWAARDERVSYSRFAWQANLVDLDVLADIVFLVNRVYRPHWVGDTGGHGAVAMLNTLAGRLHMAFDPKPTDIAVSCRVMNDDYRTGRIKHPTSDVETQRVLEELDRQHWEQGRKDKCREVIVEGTQRLAMTTEIQTVARTLNPRTGRVEINKKGKHSDISEANRYAHHASRHWAAPVPVPEKSRHELRQEWLKKKRERKRRHERYDEN